MEIETVRCDFKYSRVAAAPVCTAALATLVLVAVIFGDGALGVALTAYVSAQALRALISLHRVAAARIHLDGSVTVEWRDGTASHGKLRDGGFVCARLACVRWRRHGARFDSTVLVLPDMLAPGTFRRLRIVLRAA